MWGLSRGLSKTEKQCDTALFSGGHTEQLKKTILFDTGVFVIIIILVRVKRS